MIYNPFLNDNFSEEIIKKSIDILLDPPSKIDSQGNKYWENSKGQIHRMEIKNSG